MSERDKMSREVLITKEYKTMSGFLRGCRAVLNEVFDDPYGDTLTTVTNFTSDERTVEEKIRDGGVC